MLDTGSVLDIMVTRICKNNLSSRMIDLLPFLFFVEKEKYTKIVLVIRPDSRQGLPEQSCRSPQMRRRN